MSLQLHAKTAGSGPAVILLHGLFGSGANLGALSRALRDTYTVHSLDLPNHGRSAWLEAPGIPSMARAVQDWMSEAGIDRAHLVGHSLGGKVAMQLALVCPAQVASLTVADIAPVAYPPRHDGVFEALSAVERVRCESREAAAEVMALYLEEVGVIQFLLASLVRGEGGALHWRFDLSGLRSHYGALSAAPEDTGIYPGSVQFVCGADSAYVQESHWPAITSLFPAATREMMPGCGHWLHVQDPETFNALVTHFIAGAEQAEKS